MIDRHDAADFTDTLLQIDDLFRQSAQIARAGEQAFFSDDFLLRNAAVGVIVRLGEAAKNLPIAYVESRADVRYRGLIRMRDAVAHRYDTVDWHLVWEAIAVLHPADATAHADR